MIIDFHSHILPEVDHGSDSLKTSLNQVSLAARYGVNRIVATSHFYPHSRSAADFVERRNRSYEKLIENLGHLNVSIALGAEVLICNSIDKLPYISDLCIRGTKTLLLELPFADFQVEYCKSIYNLVTRGFTVVMAHAERYDKSWIEETIEAGAKLQLNAGAFSLFKIKRYSLWLENGDVVAIGSDVHGADGRAFRKFAMAAAKAEKSYVKISEFSDSLWNNIQLFN